ncbi:MAG: Uma2 family endonuclease [Gemmataceae bacterium]|nr:Uma2 family endonuclease [Gemmataceae bacterium]
MSAAPKPTKLTVAEYLTRERAADRKSEFVDGVMYAMAGASPAHNKVKDNLIVELGTRFKGTGCRTFSSDQRVRVAPAGPYYYPDIAVVCGPEEYDDADPDSLVNPLILVEVLSDSTERYDRRFKFRQYQRIAAFREYVLVAQDEPFVERWVRQPDGAWLPQPPAVGPDAVLALSTVPVSVPLTDVYAGVTFPPEPSAST